MYKGFCNKDDEEKKENEDDFDLAEGGVGVGQGKGVKNTSDQIEFEEQVQGDNAEKQ